MQSPASSVGFLGGNSVGSPSSVSLGVTESLGGNDLTISGLVLSLHTTSGRGENAWLWAGALEELLPIAPSIHSQTGLVPLTQILAEHRRSVSHDAESGRGREVKNERQGTQYV